ncbi:DUF4867 family protein [Cuneatibacter caecimuris]|uniref:Uncharacterized protein DUF4867 n=1 Tax=Cuneatibacter caecimuris TaxID=1796618 RepID=A0A4Q7PR73_9FIRM|nr:DUF4867 family protein [Cuneatibacter caecimuris]RZT03055.1 uncharacterized protein DUF4867 [Cuneatibacter caecimuris]
MDIQKVTDAGFAKYGRVISGYSLEPLLEEMEKTPLPEGVDYVPSVPELEALPVFEELTESMYGGLPVQIGYCNGHNHLLNALEYHRSSEVDIAVGRDLILLLGCQQDMESDYSYDTAKAEAFLLPAGVGVELYATTLHYAPCSAAEGEGFRCVVVLPRDTNLPLEKKPAVSPEDALMTARNKWLIAHPDAGIEGAVCGLKGENLRV